MLQGIVQTEKRMHVTNIGQCPTEHQYQPEENPAPATPPPATLPHPEAIPGPTGISLHIFEVLILL